MSDKTTHQVLASLYSFVARHEVNPNYPAEMRLIADTLDHLQDQRNAMQSQRFRDIDAMFPKPSSAGLHQLRAELAGDQLLATGRAMSERMMELQAAIDALLAALRDENRP